ncbi:sigma factor [Lysinibacillus sphaericus]|uniref:Sigma-70 region 2 domain-containing protein n=1 Tax=Lysinibacillus sphaericus OT4b.31 TaxID=1285586 RepID=R7Z9K0_LYSSH|nr:sigma factor [Lysinibacillus sphaericus]EON70803.1 sigma-70 region 2 domain-containing protein [Lysinibacillus sphaericus OT4b.31]
MNELFGKHLQEKLKTIQFTLLKMGAGKQDAEDILQETAYQFSKYIDGIDTEFAEAWLYRVAINKYYDALKNKKLTNVLPRKRVLFPDQIMFFLEKKTVGNKLDCPGVCSTVIAQNLILGVFLYLTVNAIVIS